MQLCPLRRPGAPKTTNTQHQYLGTRSSRLPTCQSNIWYNYALFTYAPSLLLSFQSLRTYLRNPELPGVTGVIRLFPVTFAIMPYQLLFHLCIPYHFSSIVSTLSSLLLVIFSYASRFHHIPIIPHRFFICLKADVIALTSYHSSIHPFIYQTICSTFPLSYFLLFLIPTSSLFPHGGVFFHAVHFISCCFTLPHVTYSLLYKLLVLSINTGTLHLVQYPKNKSYPCFLLMDCCQSSLEVLVIASRRLPLYGLAPVSLWFPPVIPVTPVSGHNSGVLARPYQQLRFNSGLSPVSWICL